MMTKRLGALAVSAAMALLSGCGGGFFIDGTSTTTTTSSTGDYVYAVNSLTNSIYGYSVGSAALTAVSGSPVTAVSGLAASSIVVSRANTFVYVGGLGTISSYSIGTGGALTVLASQAISAVNTNFAALETSPDGQWLFALDSQNVVSPAVYVYKINTSTGALTLTSTVAYTAAGTGTLTPKAMHIAPTGNFLAIALGADGDALFTFNTTSGLLTFTYNFGVAGYSDNAVQFDSTGQNLFTARGVTGTGTSQLATYTVNSNGTVTAATTVTTGNTPYALLLESAGTYLYSANRSDSTVSGYTVSSGALTALSGSPYAGSTYPSALVEDKSHSYVFSYGADGGTDLTLYKFDALTPGRLDAVATGSSGASANLANVAVAATHGSGVVQ